VKIGIAAAFLALALPAAALAKGPTEALISGPGLAKPLKLGGPGGWTDGSPMAELTSRAGFFQVVWGGQPGQTLTKSPTKDLGPRYRVVYVVPGPSGTNDRIHQDLYPFAKGGALTYTPRGQRFFDTRRTLGGWFRVVPPLTATLVAAGLPRPTPPIAPTAGREGNSRPRWPLPIAALFVLVAFGTVAVRRRTRTAPA
jgi:hypothetical protein